MITVDNVLIDTGTMQVIDLIGKLLLEKGDTVVLGDPTFVTALQVFTLYHLQEGMDADAMLDEAIAEKAMYAPGSCNHAGAGGPKALRLNFSAYTEEKIHIGIERLAKVIRRS